MALAMASHFERVRLAIMMSVNTSGFCATLCATTVPTPPAPIISTFPIFMFSDCYVVCICQLMLSSTLL